MHAGHSVRLQSAASAPPVRGEASGMVPPRLMRHAPGDSICMAPVRMGVPSSRPGEASPSARPGAHGVCRPGGRARGQAWQVGAAQRCTGRPGAGAVQQSAARDTAQRTGKHGARSKAATWARSATGPRGWHSSQACWLCPPPGRPTAGCASAAAVCCRAAGRPPAGPDRAARRPAAGTAGRGCRPGAAGRAWCGV